MSDLVTDTFDNSVDSTEPEYNPPDTTQQVNETPDPQNFAKIEISQTIAILLHSICSDPNTTIFCDCALAKISKFYMATMLQYLLTSENEAFKDLIKIKDSELTPLKNDNKLPDFKELWDSLKQKHVK